MSASDSGNRPTGRPTEAGASHQDKSAGQRPEAAEYSHERLSSTPRLSESDTCKGSLGRGLGRAALLDLSTRLSPRDVVVLDLIAEHRFLTTLLVEQFCFYDHASTASGARSARRVLARLERDRLIWRPVRRVGGIYGGSMSSVWMLTSSGQRLRSIRAGRGAVGQVRAPGERFIAHYLAIAETRLAIVNAEREGRLHVLQLQIEPRAWRGYTGLGGQQEVLKPDMAAITTSGEDAEYEDHWLLEVDRGTESLPTLLKQCERYEAYRRSGHAQTKYGVFPIVIWIVPDERRAQNLRSRLRAASKLNADDYRVTTPDGLLAVLTGGAR